MDFLVKLLHLIPFMLNIDITEYASHDTVVYKLFIQTNIDKLFCFL